MIVPQFEFQKPRGAPSDRYSPGELRDKLAGYGWNEPDGVNYINYWRPI